MSEVVFGTHPVLELLRLQRRSVIRVVMAEGRGGAVADRIVAAAREAGVTVQRQPEKALDRLAVGGSHQGVLAFVAAADYADAAEVLERVRSASRPALLVVLDGVQDPRNLGAVIRTAAAAGADGLFLPERGAAGLTAAAIKVSEGATERLPVCRVGNIVHFLKLLKEHEIWVVGLDPGATRPWTAFDLKMPVALVMGGEEGLRRLARETCDDVVSIPLSAGVESLNLSVAAGVILFEAVRQRREVGASG